MTSAQVHQAAPFSPVAPYLTVDDARAAIDFYERAFGAKLINRNDTADGSKVIHAELSLNGGQLMLSDDFPEMTGSARTPKALGGSPVTLHLELPDVDATWARALAAGATVVMPLSDTFWGSRYGMMTDPFGHRWSLATQKKEPTAEELRAGVEKHFPASG